MMQYIYILILFNTAAANDGASFDLIEAELRLDPISCMAKAQEINAGMTDNSKSFASCLPILWSDTAEAYPDILKSKDGENGFSERME